MNLLCSHPSKGQIDIEKFYKSKKEIKIINDKK